MHLRTQIPHINPTRRTRVILPWRLQAPLILTSVYILMNDLFDLTINPNTLIYK